MSGDAANLLRSVSRGDERTATNAAEVQAIWFESMLPRDNPLNAARSIDVRAGDRSLPPDRL
jgi:hypothetical protein